MKKFLAPLVLLTGVLLFQCSCTNAGAIIVTGLRVELTGIERTTVGTATVSWRVVNPNVASYLLAEVRHKIYLNGTLAGTTFSDDPLGVPAQGNASGSSKLTLAGPAAGLLLTDAAAQGRAAYRVESKLLIQIYGEQTEKGDLTNSGSVAVVSK